MKAKSLLSAAILCASAITAVPSLADLPAASPQIQLVGLVNAPPFAMKDTAGNWEGIVVDLWRHVAGDLGIKYQLMELPIPELIAGLQAGTLLAVLTATASAEREMQVDFSHPYYSSGLTIAVRAQGEGGSWLDLPANVFSRSTAKIMGLLFGLLFIAAILVWICERRANPEHFALSPLKGIPASLWWACVTATTVG